MTMLKAEKRDPQVKAKKLRREGYVTGILSGLVFYMVRK